MRSTNRTPRTSRPSSSSSRLSTPRTTRLGKVIIQIENITDEERAIKIIQKCVRGYLARLKSREIKIQTYREIYQKQFDTIDGYQRCRFEQYGAAIRIQKWFKNWKFRNKKIWHQKYAKVITHYQHQKVLLHAFQKKKIVFQQEDLNNPEKCQEASSIVITTLLRGFMIRKRYQKKKQETARLKRRQQHAIVKIQAFVRAFLVHLKYPELGKRYRLFHKKYIQQIKRRKHIQQIQEYFQKEKTWNVSMYFDQLSSSSRLTSSSKRFANQSTEQATNQTINKYFIKQPVEQSTKLSNKLSNKLSTTQSTKFSKQQSIKQFTGQSTKISTKQTSKQTIKQATKLSTGLSIKQSTKPITKASTKQLPTTSTTPTTTSANIVSSPTPSSPKKTNLFLQSLQTELTKQYAFYPHDFDFFQRRNTCIFPSCIQLGNEKRIDQVENAIIKIQSHCRRWLTRKKLHVLLSIRFLEKAKHIKKWWKQVRWRSKVRRTMIHMKPMYLESIVRKQKEKNAITKIQNSFRTYNRRRTMKSILNIRRYCALKIQKWLIYRYACYCIHRQVLFRRNQLELTKAGLDMYNNTILRWHSHYLWQGVKKTKSINEKSPYELQRIFFAHSLNGGLDFNKVLKIFRDCTNLIDESYCTVNNIEIQFTKVKYGNEKRIDYAKFLELIANIAVIKILHIEPSKGLWENGIGTPMKALVPRRTTIRNPNTPLPSSDSKDKSDGSLPTTSSGNNNEDMMSNTPENNDDNNNSASIESKGVEEEKEEKIIGLIPIPEHDEELDTNNNTNTDKTPINVDVETPIEEKTKPDDLLPPLSTPQPPRPTSSGRPTSSNGRPTSSGSPSRPNRKTILNNSNKDINVLEYKYGSLKGKSALITQFVIEYIATLKDYQKVVDFLQSKASIHQTTTLISDAYHKIQAFFHNRIAIRQITQELKAYRMKKRDLWMHQAANKIQSLMKGHLGRMFIMKMAQNLYNKYIDGQSKRPYWYNPRTNQYFWTKPLLLGKYDCGVAVYMPCEYEMNSIMCSQCEKVYAVQYCQECDACYCNACYASYHKAGNRKQHTTMTMDNCIQCEFQIGTRYCYNCSDLFCDSCFDFVHAKGRLRFHPFRRNCLVCEECETRSAIWKESGILPTNDTSTEANYPFPIGAMLASSSKRTSSPNDFAKSHRTVKFSSTTSSKSASTKNFKNMASQSIVINTINSKLWCGTCYYHEYKIVPVENKPANARLKSTKISRNNNNNNTFDDQSSIESTDKILYRLKFYGKAIEEYKFLKEKQKKEKEVKDIYKKRQQLLFYEKQIQCCIRIQRLYRGYKVRQDIASFVQERKAFFILRKEEDKIRYAWYTILKAWLGFPTLFDSDTPLERVQKLHPWYMHSIIAECIENDWNYACQLMIEHDSHMKAQHSRPSWIHIWTLKYRVQRCQRRVEKSTLKYEEKLKFVENSKQRFDEANDIGAYEENKLKSMKKQITTLDKQLQKLLEQKEKDEELLQQANDQLLDCIGPRGLQLLIADRRQFGILLPFTVTIKKNSRYALIEYPEQYEHEDEYGQNTDENPLFQAYSMSQRVMSPGGTSRPMPRWMTKLKVRDHVYINHFLYQIVKDDANRKTTEEKQLEDDVLQTKKEANEEDEEEEENEEDNNETNANNDDQISAITSNDIEEGNASPKKPMSQKKGTTLANIEGEYHEETITDNHIRLDRPWMFDNVQRIPIYKYVYPVCYLLPWFYLYKLCLKSYPVQKYIAINVIWYHKVYMFCQYLINTFYNVEENDYSDSMLFTLIQSLASYATRRKEMYLGYSYSLIQLSFDFALKRFVVSMFMICFRFGSNISKLGLNVMKNAQSQAKETPYEFWQRSLYKETIKCIYEMGVDKSLDIGEFKIDTNAPVDVMREYLYRNFRDLLNQNTGESFLFMRINIQKNNREEILHRDDEFKTYTKDYLVEKTDRKTLETTLTVTIVKDPDRGRVLISEEFVLKTKNKNDNNENEEDEDEEMNVEDLL